HDAAHVGVVEVEQVPHLPVGERSIEQAEPQRAAEHGCLPPSAGLLQDGDKHVDRRVAAGRQRAADPVEHARPARLPPPRGKIVRAHGGEIRAQRLGERHRVGLEVLLHAPIYCGVIPASRMTLRHCTTSDLIHAFASAGVPPAGSRPCSRSCTITPSDFRTRLASMLSRATASAGLPAGAAIPYQPVTSKPGRPLSATVGTSGASCERLVEVTASARSLPEAARGIALTAGANIMRICPLRRSVIAGTAPL